MSERRQYSDQEKAEALAALAAHGGDVALTARKLGIPERTLNHWAHGVGAPPHVANLGEQKKEALATRLEALAHTCVDILPDKLETARAKEVATALGIAVDKMQLLRGEATAITEDVSRARTTLQRKIAGLAAAEGEGELRSESNGHGSDPLPV